MPMPTPAAYPFTTVQRARCGLALLARDGVASTYHSSGTVDERWVARVAPDVRFDTRVQHTVFRDADHAWDRSWLNICQRYALKHPEALAWPPAVDEGASLAGRVVFAAPRPGLATSIRRDFHEALVWRA